MAPEPLAVFRRSTSTHICFPSSRTIPERSSLSRACSAAPDGAPLTAPGRSGENSAGQEGKQIAETYNLREFAPCLSLYEYTLQPSQGLGLNATEIRRLQLVGGVFSLDISPYRTGWISEKD